MTTAEPTAIGRADPTEGNSHRDWFSPIDHLIGRLSDRLNPILVKEARQALKSRHFTITFTLLLACGWGWSVLGVMTQMPDIYYAPSGRSLLVGYYLILAVPMLLVVPFSTFRSLAAEREDGTYELLSISTLSSRQIVTGKLGSAMLQMIVYYSALAPCVAFTYLLRGIDLITLALLLFYTFFVSIILSSLGLVFAGMSRNRQWQSLVSVLLLLGLIVAGMFWGSIVAQLLMQGATHSLAYNSWEFWSGHIVGVANGLMYIILFIHVAAAQNSFASDNRSSRIRVVLSLQTLVFLGSMSYFWMRDGDYGYLVVVLIMGGLHWLVYGILLSSESGTFERPKRLRESPRLSTRLAWYVIGHLASGETAHLSSRVRRRLPQSFLGRMLFTWFNPGSGTGYIFAACNMLLLCGFVVVAAFFETAFSIPQTAYQAWSISEEIGWCALLIFSYFVGYLGFSRLIVMLVPGRERLGIAFSVLIHCLVMLAGSALPFVYESWLHRYRSFSFSGLQATNWLWAIADCLDDKLIPVHVIMGVVAVSWLILLMNLISVRYEVASTHRVKTPDRVLEDDAVDQVIESNSPRDPLAD